MVSEEGIHQLPDSDPEETQEWIESLRGLIRDGNTSRAHYLLTRVAEEARALGISHASFTQTDYINSIPLSEQPPYPGDLELEKRIRAITRWNAVAMVERANSRAPGLGGHLATYASAATLFEVGLNHLFRGNEILERRDHLYFQGHAAPGIYARAFLEGRLSAEQLDHFRREVSGNGLPSYPHPRRLPDFWEYPTVSMGLGALNAVAQAHFNRYLSDRNLVDTSASRVWAFLGDGEMAEPETLTAVAVAGRERLGNLTFVVNCNLQRLDGPVLGSGKIVQECEGLFRGAGWNVIKVVWGGAWDALLARDVHGHLLGQMNATPDGTFQTYTTSPGAFIREDFFGAPDQLRQLVEHLSDREIERLPRGGHDPEKVFAAYAAANARTDRPTVVLAKTVKGWALGSDVEGRNATHQIKHLDADGLREFRDRLQIPIADSDLVEGVPPYFHPGHDSPEVQYLVECRARLGGPIPKRRSTAPRRLAAIPDAPFAYLKVGNDGDRTATTTAALARVLRDLLRDPAIGPRIVPIVADEGRTFGWDGLFAEAHVHAHAGQNYERVDAGLVLSYKESPDGQILQAGICEALAVASMTAAGSTYSSWDFPMLPIYATYSMFGFQRTGDALWAMSDQMCSGLLVGGTAGRTSLAGEGLQHCDGQSLLLASANPGCRSYDPAYAYELAVIVEDELRRALVHAQPLAWTYVTVYNEATPQPAMPDGIEADILGGISKVAAQGTHPRVRLFGSGVLLHEALAASKVLASDHGIDSEVFSVTSYQMLRTESEAAQADRRNRDVVSGTGVVPTTLERVLGEVALPIVAVTDYQRLVADQIRPYLDSPFEVLGTDGFGLSDTREALREHFHVSCRHIVGAALRTLGIPENP